jgi:hypothetical protein
MDKEMPAQTKMTNAPTKTLLKPRTVPILIVHVPFKIEVTCSSSAFNSKS